MLCWKGVGSVGHLRTVLKSSIEPVLTKVQKSYMLFSLLIDYTLLPKLVLAFVFGGLAGMIKSRFVVTL